MQTLRFDQKVTLQEIITENEQLCTSFVEYLASIHAIEAFEFWIEVELYKRILDEDECTKTAKFIFTTYLSPHSPTEINLEGRIRRELLENFSKNPNDPHLFNKAQDSVEMMLKYDCLRVFLEVNKGKVRKSSHEPSKKGKDKIESHALLQRYNSLIKLEKKKVRRDSFKKSISGTIRRFTTDQPKSIALTIKSNSFSVESKTMGEMGADVDERRSDGEESSKVTTMRRARGKKIRLDPERRWAMTVSEETPKEDTAKEEETEKEADATKGIEAEKEEETPKESATEEKEITKSGTPSASDWVSYERPPQPPLNEAGNTEWLVGGARSEEKGRGSKIEEKTKTEKEEPTGETKDKMDKCSEVAVRKESTGGGGGGGREKRRSGGGLRFMCFGGTKKKP